ncbi:hypothetical protein WNY51_00695 [Pseudocolwellia sp. AS88]|uniref:hypothetical protein n=1 Tax=Pseudocolwellia sp. AS88 TaxID=3063958 RepID=UPI0026F03BF0|nr:hypothetical protein [Pseudocolwellia sp. AS88]MDO7086417.1 hypothetical protein [Pseudocolwellia sp. AS88]
MEHIFIIVVGLFIIIAFSIRVAKRSKIKKSQLQGITYITQLKPLISLVQQHRGLTSAWLNGDENVKPKLVNLQNEIKQVIHLLNKTDLQANERWMSFYDHWQRMLEFKIKPSVSNSFDQHCSLIKNLSYLLEDTSESYFLTSEHHKGFPNIGYTWRELIVLTENIGQARAIGTGVSVQKHCSSVDKIRLSFLAENMTKVSTGTLNNLHYLSDEIEKHNNHIQIARSKIQELTLVIAKELVNSTDITIESQDYFSMASNTISAFDDIFYHQVDQLKRLI